ncbi:hypothetical protein [Microtetraspora sp. NBRC 16547]|uniref:hypothetical protein n=1 Tax=Microtetraspora sp. NBRC 16547 TaxID=3030993 RepID=UPI0024A1DA93|nr:hypothetical protein [Microtetraspora sp. NBRC 16547]GLX01613.1 hypothetical protein Misp02_56990 [Microtetraspora sp. NBRC 16547]
MHDQMPTAMPLLSRGKHRNPSKGACFMELASFLAGERWSDHPACTHPLLAGLARLVNDHTTDAARPLLAPLIPSVIGLAGDDPRIDARIALRCAISALPVVSHERQLALAVSVLSAEHVLSTLDGRPNGSVGEQSALALAQVPDAARWAYRFRRGVRVSAKGFRRYAAPNTVQLAVRGISEACVADPDAMLRKLLTDTIGDCAELVRHEAPVDRRRWEDACRLTRR